LSKRIYLVY